MKYIVSLTLILFIAAASGPENGSEQVCRNHQRCGRRACLRKAVRAVDHGFKLGADEALWISILNCRSKCCPINLQLPKSQTRVRLTEIRIGREQRPVRFSNWPLVRRQRSEVQSRRARSFGVGLQPVAFRAADATHHSFEHVERER